jgi:hypothetical protein
MMVDLIHRVPDPRPGLHSYGRLFLKWALPALRRPANDGAKYTHEYIHLDTFSRLFLRCFKVKWRYKMIKNQKKFSKKHIVFGALSLMGLAAVPASCFSQGLDLTSPVAELKIPAAAVPAKLRASSQAMTVVIDGKVELLAPGAHIRNPQRQLVFPAQLPFFIGQQEVAVKIERDMQGQLIRIWMLPPKN